MVGRGQWAMRHEAAVLGPWERAVGGGGAATEAYVGRVAYVLSPAPARGPGKPAAHGR